MTQQSRLRRMGWIAVLALCTVFYLGLHLKVHAVRSEVIGAERRIVALETEKNLLATEFETRASQEQLASWCGASREATVKALAALRSLGCIATGRRSVLIRDAEALRRHARGAV